MPTTRFTARTLSEAMAMVKAALGPDAVILQIEEKKTGGFLGLFRKKQIQVTASRRVDVARSTGFTEQAGLAGGGRAVPAPVRDAAPSAGPAAPDAAAAVPSDSDDAQIARETVTGMRAAISQIRERMTQTTQAGRTDAGSQELLTTLLAAGIDEDAARGLVSRVRSRLAPKASWTDVMQTLREVMASDLGRAETIHPQHRTVALVGPTGVGKTTTLAKLAAQELLQHGRSVGFITLDTYKIGAVDQLRIYSEILGVPLEVAYDLTELRVALDKLADRDLILVDTAGRSPRNMTQLNELKMYLDVLNPHETYLVMSLTSGYRDAVRIVENYLDVGVDRLLFTKWDEAETPGLIYNVVGKYRRPLSYITTGQNVPEDIEVANPKAVVQAILGE